MQGEVNFKLNVQHTLQRIYYFSGIFQDRGTGKGDSRYIKTSVGDMDFIEEVLLSQSIYTMSFIKNNLKFGSHDYFNVIQNKINKIAAFFDDGTLSDQYYQSTSDIILYRDAGWHFSSVLDDKGCNKKMTGAADYDPSMGVVNFSKFRMWSPHP